MTATLGHRGPDGEGCWLHDDAGIGLAHCRLTIIDPESGDQPMWDSSDRVVIVFNGAVYNYVELRESLAATGREFRTRSDTETIINSYLAADGAAALAFVDSLRGMYAFAIWDEARKCLVLARDRVGKKPLFYTEADDEFIFASEIQAVAQAMRKPPTLDPASLRRYLSWGCVPGPGTIYREIKSLLPGEVVLARDRKIERRRRHHALADYEPHAMVPHESSLPAMQECVESVDKWLQESVRIRLRADVPVGCFLSGGIDSGLVTAIAAESSAHPIKTITVGFESQQFDERPLAAEVARRYGTDHVEIPIHTDVRNDLARIARAYGQPYADSSAIPSFYVAAAARSHVKVVLNGDGGDELFGGYRRYVAAGLADNLVRGDSSFARRCFAGLARLLPRPNSFRTSYSFLRRVVRGLAMGSLDRYRAWVQDGFSDDEIRHLLPSDGGDGVMLNEDDLAQTLAANGISWRSPDSFHRQMAYADLLVVLPYDLLTKMDIACMHHGLEGRSPLLDTNLIHRAWPMGLRYGRRGFSTKPILRQLARRYLPEVVCRAPKRGFEVPLIDWMRGELRDVAEDVLLSRNGLLQQLFRRDRLESLLREKQSLDPGSWARRVWILLMLGMWDSESG
jgi:asparagine synthase (glutamine-hydrolysing)